MIPLSIEELRAEHERVLREYEHGRARLAETRRGLRAVAGEAESDDGLVRATVGRRSQLVRLEIAPRAYHKLTPTELADLIVETVNRASSKATERVRELLAPFLAPDAPFEKLLNGEANWSDHVRVPRPGGDLP